MQALNITGSIGEVIRSKVQDHPQFGYFWQTNATKIEKYMRKKKSWCQLRIFYIGQLVVKQMDNCGEYFW